MLQQHLPAHAAGVDAVIEGMKWLDLTWDGDWISQFARSETNAAAARRLLLASVVYLPAVLVILVVDRLA